MTETHRNSDHRAAMGDARLSRWVDRVQRLPDLRWDKVMRVRRALESNAYDPDALLDAALLPLGQDLGVTCR